METTHRHIFLSVSQLLSAPLPPLDQYLFINATKFDFTKLVNQIKCQKPLFYLSGAPPPPPPPLHDWSVFWDGCCVRWGRHRVINPHLYWAWAVVECMLPSTSPSLSLSLSLWSSQYWFTVYGPRQGIQLNLLKYIHAIPPGALYLCGRRQLGYFLVLLNINDVEVMADSNRPQH